MSHPIHYRLLLSNGGPSLYLSVDPIPSVPNLYNFLLFSKAGGIERRLCTPVQLKLSFDPTEAEFDVCLTPKEQSLPPNSHHSLRIWIRRPLSGSAGGPLNPIYRHRLFSHDDMWFGKFPLDVFASHSSGGGSRAMHGNLQTPPATGNVQRSISANAMMMTSPPVRPRSAPDSELNAQMLALGFDRASQFGDPPIQHMPSSSTLRGGGPGGIAPGSARNPQMQRGPALPPPPVQQVVLAAPEEISDDRHKLSAKINGVGMSFIVMIIPARVDAPDSGEYYLSLEYEAGGISRYLIRNLDLRITTPLSGLGFTIYSKYLKRTSTGTLHHLAIWICSPQSPDPASSSASVTGDNFVNGMCQRLWKTDTFLVTSPVLALPSAPVGGGNRLTTISSVSLAASHLTPPGGEEGMLLAGKHVQSPLVVELPGAPRPGGMTRSGTARSRRTGIEGDTQDGVNPQSQKEWEAQGEGGAVDDEWELPAYAYSQLGA
ncbi:hypothetical protein DL93DRAFT_2165193 [Clavulina sp. PMI_390]|nr:hypothetical protein DL93DRAFT_2165193 [Clavulina sp. PMI_390]